MPPKTPSPLAALDTLPKLRQAILDHKAEGQKIISHFKQMELYYSEWEDRLLQIHNAIQDLEIQTGLDKEELLAPTPEPELDVFKDLGLC